MPLYLIERQFAEPLEISAASAARIKRINDEVGVKWMNSFLSADKMKTYCLYEGPNVETIREAARRSELPADVVVEVCQVDPSLLI